MAELEHQLGVKATFYVMARSPYYNPFSHAGMQIVRRISELGHTLGVHSDPDGPRDSLINPGMAWRNAWTEHKMLARCFPMTRHLSFHCPPEGLLWVHVPQFVSAYAPEWQGHYRSDSAPLGEDHGRFAYGDPEDAQTRPLQVNLHPEHWFPPLDEYPAFWR